MYCNTGGVPYEPSYLSVCLKRYPPSWKNMQKAQAGPKAISSRNRSVSTFGSPDSMHEICHAFVFERRHSTNGVMSAAIFKFPLLPVLFNFPEYVSEEDRQEILQNKWRNFNGRRRPQLASRLIQCRIVPQVFHNSPSPPSYP